MKVQDIVKLIDYRADVCIYHEYEICECEAHKDEEWNCVECEEYISTGKKGDECLYQIVETDEFNDFCGICEEIPIKLAEHTVEGIAVREFKSRYRKKVKGIAIRIRN